MKRRHLLGGAAALPLAQAVPAGAPDGAKVLRYAVDFAETGFDPPRVSDQSSILVLAHIFEAPLSYDLLARPVKLVAQTAEGLPELSADYRHCIVTLRRGIHFADDPVFQGRPRELVAADQVYSIKRFFDPALRSEHLYQWENVKLLGLSELRQRALKDKTPFDYDAPVAGLRVLDRYRLELRLAEPAPRLLALLANVTTAGAMAREVIEAYAADNNAHPVGTGPFRLKEWRRASRIVLVKNRRFREQRFDAAPAADDAAAQAVARRLQGARAPLLDRIEIDVIVEDQPRWLAFLRGEHDLHTLPSPFAGQAMPQGRLAPYLAQRGIFVQSDLAASISHTFFNFDDALVGGYGPERVALRRAIALAYSSAEELRLVRNGQGIVAQSMIPPHCWGYDADLVSEPGSPSPARARALLEMHGYLDRNGDGWRERPDGKPLVLRIAFPADQRSRQVSELWLKRLKAVGLKVFFEVAPFGELIRRSLAGQLMMWGFNWGAGAPDGDFFLGLAYGPNAEQSNDARFRLAAFDRLYERQRVLPDGPERAALMRQATKLMLAYMPYIPHLHPVVNTLAHAHVLGPLRHPFNRDVWRWIDVQPTATRSS